MPAPLDRNGFQPQIDRHEMPAGSDTALAQDRGCQKPTKPGRMLEDGDFIPGVEGDDRLCGFYFQISIRGMSYASWVLALNWRRFSANDFSEALCQSDFTIEVRRRRARSRTSTG